MNSLVLLPQVMVDPSDLAALLGGKGSDGDSDDDGDGLQHHAGADKALAGLIGLKKSGRKKGAQEAQRQAYQIRLRALDFLEVGGVLWLPLWEVGGGSRGRAGDASLFVVDLRLCICFVAFERTRLRHVPVFDLLSPVRSLSVATNSKCALLSRKIERRAAVVSRVRAIL